MEKIETITDTFGGVHVIVYKSETEWTSYTKAAYDAQVEHLTSPLTTEPAGDVVQ